MQPVIDALQNSIIPAVLTNDTHGCKLRDDRDLSLVFGYLTQPHANVFASRSNEQPNLVGPMAGQETVLLARNLETIGLKRVLCGGLNLKQREVERPFALGIRILLR